MTIWYNALFLAFRGTYACASAIDLPEQKADRWQHVVTVPAGRACLLNALPDPEEPSKVRILVVEPRVHK